MEINEFVNNFAEQFEETDREVFTSQTVFKDLDEWSSLTALSVIAMIDEEYGVSLKGDDLAKSNTIEELFNNIQAK